MGEGSSIQLHNTLGGTLTYNPPDNPNYPRNINHHRRVQRGIKALDAHVPQWRSRIEVDHIRMEISVYKNDCGCILAQLFGTYSHGMDVLKLDEWTAIELGFLGDCTWDHDPLTIEWRETLR